MFDILAQIKVTEQYLGNIDHTADTLLTEALTIFHVENNLKR